MKKSLEARLSAMEKRTAVSGTMTFITSGRGVAAVRYNSSEERKRLEEESRRNSIPMSTEAWLLKYGEGSEYLPRINGPECPDDPEHRP